MAPDITRMASACERDDGVGGREAFDMKRFELVDVRGLGLTAIRAVGPDGKPKAPL